MGTLQSKDDREILKSYNTVLLEDENRLLKVLPINDSTILQIDKYIYKIIKNFRRLARQGYYRAPIIVSEYDKKLLDKNDFIGLRLIKNKYGINTNRISQIILKKLRDYGFKIILGQRDDKINEPINFSNIPPKNYGKFIFRIHDFKRLNIIEHEWFSDIIRDGNFDIDFDKFHTSRTFHLLGTNEEGLIEFVLVDWRDSPFGRSKIYNEINFVLFERNRYIDIMPPILTKYLDIIDSKIKLATKKGFKDFIIFVNEFHPFLELSIGNELTKRGFRVDECDEISPTISGEMFELLYHTGCSKPYFFDGITKVYENTDEVYFANFISNGKNCLVPWNIPMLRISWY